MIDADAELTRWGLPGEDHEEGRGTCDCARKGIVKHCDECGELVKAPHYTYSSGRAGTLCGACGEAHRTMKALNG